MSTWKPYYRRDRPAYQPSATSYTERRYAAFGDDIPQPPVEGGDSLVEGVNDARDERARAVIATRTGDFDKLAAKDKPAALVTQHHYNQWTTRPHLEDSLCLGLLAFADYFKADPGTPSLVSGAILASQPGWCGAFGPDMNQGRALLGTDPDKGDFSKATKSEGNYDMGQMFLTAIAYAYYDELTPAAQMQLIEQLLGQAKIARLNKDDIVTSGPLPDDWDLAGYFKLWPTPPFYTGPDAVPGINIKDIGETENHIFTILTARYLTNQLLYQRTYDQKYDNLRNAGKSSPSCTALVLQLLQNVLRDDFSEYNAKNYQEETRWALLNLSSYAYDDQVRLAARMVLDYVSAKMAVSSSELRRLLPFRRRDEDPKNKHDANAFMQCGVVFTYGPDITTAPDTGADPMVPYFALQSGNTRACRVQVAGKPARGMPRSNELPLEVVTDYRVPDPIIDLIVNNPNRRIFQRLHRRVVDNDSPGQKGGNRSADCMEIYAASPSYLITAGGAPTDYAIDPRVSGVEAGLIAGAVSGYVAGLAALSPYLALLLVLTWGGIGAMVGAIVDAFSKGIAPGGQKQQLGVAVTTSFLPAEGNTLLEQARLDAFGSNAVPVRANELLVQLGAFSEDTLPADDGKGEANYGVAPDFACGLGIDLPDWLTKTNKLEDDGGGWSFADFGSSKDGKATTPGFYLALRRDTDGWGDFTVLEAFDTLADPGVTFEDFKSGVRVRNPDVPLENNNVESTYETSNGSTIKFVIWKAGTPPKNQRRGAARGAEVLSVKYGDPLAPWAHGDANQDSGDLVNGTVLNSEGDAVISIHNPVLNQTIRLDLSDMWNPRRTDEHGLVEEAGNDHEVWTDFDWKGVQEGDAYRPFATLGAAEATVASYGTIRMIPSDTTDRSPIGLWKRFTLIAPIGDVKIGVK